MSDLPRRAAPPDWTPPSTQPATAQPPPPPGWAPPAGWAPPTGWGPPAPPPGPPPTVPTAVDRSGRGRAWLVCACLAALLAIYLTVITYWLSIHTVTRYQQTDPGAVVSTDRGEFSLLSLRQVSALPPGPGDTPTPEPGRAYVLATVRITVTQPDSIAASCALELVGVDGSTWDYDFLSAADPETVDADYCKSVRVGQPAQVTIGYAVPPTATGRLAGVVVQQFNGAVDLVLVPPAG